MLPLKVATWNNLKGGGDSLTKLADICQKRSGVHLDNLVACARILLNIGLGISSLQSDVHIQGSVLLPNTIAQQECG